MKRIIKIILRILGFIGALYIWLLFTYNTLDRSIQAQKATNGGYLPNKFSFLILAFIIFFFLAIPILSKKICFVSIASKVIFGLMLVIGLIVYFSAIK